MNYDETPGRSPNLIGDGSGPGWDPQEQQTTIGGFVASGDTSLGPISSPGQLVPLPTPRPGRMVESIADETGKITKQRVFEAGEPYDLEKPWTFSDTTPIAKQEIKAGEMIVIKGDTTRTAYLVLAEWPSAYLEGGPLAQTQWPLLLLAAAKDRIPEWADLGKGSRSEMSRLVSKVICRLITDEDRAFLKAEEQRKIDEAHERDRRAKENHRIQAAREKQNAEDEATKIRVARSSAEAKARSKHRARMKLLRKYGPDVARILCGFAGISMAIFGVLYAL